MIWKSLVYLLPMIVCYVGAGPIVNVTDSSACAFHSLVCNEGKIRCLETSSICNGVDDCISGQDETNCEREDFDVNNRLISTRTQEEDAVIPDTSREACAKFCREENEFKCAGFQHNLLSNECRLLDIRYSEKSGQPTLHRFWITFAFDKNSIGYLPALKDSPNFDNSKESNQDDRDDDHSIMFQSVFNQLPEDEKKRIGRQVNDNNQNRSSFSRGDFQDRSNCGTQSVAFEPPRNGRIVNGVDAPFGAYPWQVAIKLKDGQALRQWCGGSILTDRLILTAAHCIDHLRYNEFVVIVGDHDTSSSSGDEQLFEVEKYISHPEFKTSKGGHDIALVKLQTVNGKGIIFGSSVQPICLPISEKVYQSGTWCSVSGWGMQKAGIQGSASKILKVASIPLISSESCNTEQVYGNEINSVTFPDGMMCAGFLEGGTDSCSGDSGGPLSCNINGQFQLLGVVSWGEGCAVKNKPGVYTKVFHYLKWIEESSQKL